MSFFDWVVVILTAWAALAVIIAYVIDRKEGKRKQ